MPRPVSRCKRCEGKGFIEDYYAGSASYTPSIKQCPERCDIGAYSREVQRRLAMPATERPVLQQVVTGPRVQSKTADIIPFPWKPKTP